MEEIISSMRNQIIFVRSVYSNIQYVNFLCRYASNIVFSNGLLDPWSGGGVLRSKTDKITIIIIPDAAHHLDLRAAHPNDPDSVQIARSIERTEIKKWLSINEFYWLDDQWPLNLWIMNILCFFLFQLFIIKGKVRFKRNVYELNT